jgi:hypothetical protein
MGAEKSLTRNTKQKSDRGIMEFCWVFSLKACRIGGHPKMERISLFMVLPLPVVSVFGFVSQRGASKGCRSAARASVAFGWSARRIQIDRKASVPSGVPLSRPNSVSGTPKNKKSDSSFPMPDHNHIFSVKKVSAVNLPNLNSCQKLEVNRSAGSILTFFRAA